LISASRPVGNSHGARPAFSLRQLVRQGDLLVVAAMAILVALVLWIGGENANLAGILLILVTLPGSMQAFPFANLEPGLLDNVIFFGALVLGALINAALISLVVYAAQLLAGWTGRRGRVGPVVGWPGRRPRAAVRHLQAAVSLSGT
jgi:hypothetical protein